MILQETRVDSTNTRPRGEEVDPMSFRGYCGPRADRKRAIGLA